MKPMFFFRAATLGLAFVHTFPARRHLGEFFTQPSWDEGWKAFGALLAIGLYLLSPLQQLRMLYALWARRRGLLSVGGVLLSIAHLVPAIDHLPQFAAEPSWGQAWRGFGSAFATLWFLAPLPWQVEIASRVRCALDWRPPARDGRERPANA